MAKTYDERHAEIMDVSLRLFIQYGLKDTTVNEIVKAVNIAKGTFYHYFQSKEDLILELRAKYIRSYLSLTNDYMGQCKHSDWHGKIRAWCQGSIVHYYEHRAEHIALFQQQYYLDERREHLSVIIFLEEFLRTGNEVQAWHVASPDLVALLIYQGINLAFDECREKSFEELEGMTERLYDVFIKMVS
ncbi:TetR/AcrR family transcriptional regulator [Wohlfahrtiimonas chitiniclastica]|uniref:TetR/AcrR family transcriptional regulator n=1 Tax=Wohlfahrtiimonas chitiniclastica TaxID=400946 RepID=UPI000381D094|nr:TetR/AcrR family transcriptional regulator [Wohlfahrtiimonas chitiniclastica]